MRKRWLITGLIVLLLLALGAIWWMGASRPPALELAPLTIERKPVGKLPPPPAGAGKNIYYGYTRATLVDFDGDGAPELLALGEVLDSGFLKPAYTAWLSLKDGATTHRNDKFISAKTALSFRAERGISFGIISCGRDL